MDVREISPAFYFAIGHHCVPAAIDVEAAPVGVHSHVVDRDVVAAVDDDREVAAI